MNWNSLTTATHAGQDHHAETGRVGLLAEADNAAVDLVDVSARPGNAPLQLRDLRVGHGPDLAGHDLLVLRIDVCLVEGIARFIDALLNAAVDPGRDLLGGFKYRPDDEVVDRGESADDDKDADKTRDERSPDLLEPTLTPDPEVLGLTVYPDCDESTRLS